MPDDAFHVFDTTLRDGAQREGITLLGRRQARGRPAARRARRRLHRGRLAGGDAQGHRVLRPGRATASSTLRHAAAGRLRRHPQGRRAGRGRPPGARAARLAGAGGHLVAKSDVRHVEQALRTTLGGEPGDGRRHRRASWSREGRRVFLDCEHFFDGYAHDRDYGVRVLRGRGRRRRRRRRAVRHQRRHAADGRAARSSARCVERDRLPARHPRAGRHRLRGGQHRSPRSRPAPPTCRAPPTATASGPATPTCSR